MNKICKNIVIIFILFLILSFIINYCSNNNVLADDSNFDVNNFETYDSANDMAAAKNMINNSVGQIITVLRIICVAIAIVMLLVISMRYMISAPGERAEIKKYAINYVVGAFILFGVAGILSIINEIAKSIS